MNLDENSEAFLIESDKTKYPLFDAVGSLCEDITRSLNFDVIESNAINVLRNRSK